MHLGAFFPVSGALGEKDYVLMLHFGEHRRFTTFDSYGWHVCFRHFFRRQKV
jgi:hypothetical protein